MDAAEPAVAIADPPAASPGHHLADEASSAAPQVPAAPRVLPSEQLRRLADRSAAALVLPVPAVDAERELPPEALARVLDAVEASTATATKKAYRSDWQRFAGPWPTCESPKWPEKQHIRPARAAFPTGKTFLLEALGQLTVEQGLHGLLVPGSP